MAYVAIIALALAVLAALGIVLYLALKAEHRADETLAASDVVSKTRELLETSTLECERAKFELEKATTALASQKSRADALEDYVASQAQQTDPAGALAPDDVAGRVLRMSQRWAAVPGAAAGAGKVPAGTGPVVPPSAGSGAPEPAAV